MTLIIGARCKDGVALVADRRMIRESYMEVQEPEQKLRQIEKIVIGRVGFLPVMDAIEKFLNDALDQDKTSATVWDVTTAAEEVAEKYKALEADSKPFFPAVDLANGQATLYHVGGGAPPGKVAHQAWGIAEPYSNITRLFTWQDMPVNQAWHVMAVLMAVAARVSLAVGDGMDAALVKDDGSINFIDQTATCNALKKGEALVDRFLNVITDETKASSSS